MARLQVSPQTLTLPYPHRVSLELTWLKLRPLEDGAGQPMVFAHLIDGEGTVARTFDHPFPEAWDPGSEVAYPLPLYRSAIGRPLPPGDYRLTVGLHSASGRRWPLEIQGAEVVDGEYELARVVLPHPVAPAPRFRFAGAWEAPQETGHRQVVATRWLRGAEAELVIWGIDRSGEAVLRFTIPRLESQGLRLRSTEPDAAPAVDVASDCGEVRGRLAGYGSHEIRVAVPASATGERCTVTFAPSAYFDDPVGSRTFAALLETATWAPAADREPGSEWSHRRRITRSRESYSLSLPSSVAPETVLLRNLGDEIVTGPRVIVNGRKDWFSLESIVAEILEPGLSDREKAIAIWEFLVANRYHDVPTSHPLEPHDPVRLLNVYGYGFCDDAANSFMMLANQAGLRSRVWHLGGHVVAEAFYDGGWHMFDADGEVVYLSGDDRTIAGVEELSTHPGLVRRTPSSSPLYSQDLAGLYATRENNFVAQHLDGRSRHVMTFDLRPGESILRSRKHWGLHVESRTPNEPAAFGNGRLVFEPVLRDGLFRQGAEEAVHLAVEAGGDDRQELVFAPDGEGRSARLTYVFAYPYPVLQGRVRIAGELQAAGTAELRLSIYGRKASTVWSASGPGEIDARVTLDEVFATGSRRPVYWYSLSLAYASAAEGSAMRVHALRFESDFQLAPHSLPTFGEGTNEVLYLDAGEGERDLELVFGPSAAG